MRHPSWRSQARFIARGRPPLSRNITPSSMTSSASRSWALPNVPSRRWRFAATTARPSRPPIAVTVSRTSGSGAIGSPRPSTESAATARPAERLVLVMIQSACAAATTDPSRVLSSLLRWTRGASSASIHSGTSSTPSPRNEGPTGPTSSEPPVTKCATTSRDQSGWNMHRHARSPPRATLSRSSERAAWCSRSSSEVACAASEAARTLASNAL